jgi:uncharacterized membrane protein YfcA
LFEVFISRVRGAFVGYFALGAGVPASFLISGVFGNPARVAVATAVFFLGVLAGAAVAAWVIPPV